MEIQYPLPHPLKNIYGNPDVIIIKHHLAIFLDGIFDMVKIGKKKRGVKKKAFWIVKTERNIQRNLEDNKKL